jgi:arylsulfatase A-like enzyme/HEAT repeat protein
MFGLFAGVALALLEFTLVLATGTRLFLSWIELTRYAIFALSALPVMCAALGALLQRILGWLRARSPDRGAFERRLYWLGFGPGALASGVLFWSLSAGRRVRDLPGRPLVVLGLALLAGFAVAWLAVRFARLQARAERRAWRAVAFFAVSLGALWTDMHVLGRLYPAFHLGLSALAVIACLAGSVWLQRVRPGAHAARGLRLGWLGLLLVALLSLLTLSRSPNARFAIVETAPISGKLLRLSPWFDPSVAGDDVDGAGGVSEPEPAGDARGVDLRGRDVLLITVDALRADQLRAFGGGGVTPALDALAEQSLVFSRAYTPTPHTSYAISSLLTGKFMKPLLLLAGDHDEHTTLPEMLRRFGYRTAAFYPPAIFFVDSERFAALHRKQFGFEYVKAMYAPASERVTQLETYLGEVPAGYPVFVWMHLFEPHEPYEPPPEFARGDAPYDRYRGEVAAADAGVRGLVAAFRSARPDGVVIVTADHGEEFGEHGGRFHGTTLFDEQARVPALWSAPDVVRPRIVDAPIEIIDLTTTLLAALGVPRDARMRGDDLGPVLAGAAPGRALRAFASTEGERMWTDGRLKLLCGDLGCRLFDLIADPSERRDVSEQRPEEMRRLRLELEAHLASLPRIEALAMQGGGAWPEALSRARLGDRAAVPQLVPLLSDARPGVRAGAARALGEFESGSARVLLSSLRIHDPDVGVRGEAAIAALSLGDFDAGDQVAALISSPWLQQSPSTAREATAPPSELERRAAGALARQGRSEGATALLATALAPSLDEPARIAALQALAAIGDAQVGQRLLPVLSEVRLRALVAEVLGTIGGPAAIGPLADALARERYPDTRRAEARALLALGARQQAVAAIRRFLGTESSIPGGVEMLLAAGDLASPSGAGLDLRTASRVRRGAWQCEPRGCRPLAGASVALPGRRAPKGRARLVVRVEATGVQSAQRWLSIHGAAHALDASAAEIALVVEDARGLDLRLEAGEDVWLTGLVIVPVARDVPPPTPEPW